VEVGLCHVARTEATGSWGIGLSRLGCPQSYGKLLWVYASAFRRLQADINLCKFAGLKMEMTKSRAQSVS